MIRPVSARPVRSRLVGITVAGVMVVMLAGSADATTSANGLSKQQATAIALKVLKPGKGAIVFALSQPVRAEQKISEAFTAPKAAGRKSWLFWADFAPYAYFQHPSRLLLVDAATGSLVRNQLLGWWPIIDRRAPPFLSTRAGYLSKRYRVVGGAQRTIATLPARRLPAGRAADFPPGALNGDCLVLIGAYDDELFRGTFTAWEDWARGLGIKSTRVRADADGFGIADTPTNGDLVATVEKVSGDSCKDVVVVIAGHGAMPPEGHPDPFADGGGFDGDYSKLNLNELPGVTTVPLPRGQTAPPTDRPRITSRNIRELATRFGEAGVTFKIVIESCFSGRFVNDLQQKKPDNLLLTITATDAAHVSLGRVMLPEGAKSDRVEFYAPFYKDGKVANQLVQVTVPEGRSRTGPGEFSTGLFAAFSAFRASDVQVEEAITNTQATHFPFMVFVLRDMFSGSGRFDLAVKSGVTKPRILFKSAVEVSRLSHEHPAGQDFSYFCGYIGGPAGGNVRVQLTDKASGTSSTTPALVIGTDGSTRFRFRLFHSGTTFPANLRASVLGGTELAFADYAVPAPPMQGPFSCS